MFSFFRKKREPATNGEPVGAPTPAGPPTVPVAAPAATPAPPAKGGLIGSAIVAPMEVPVPAAAPERQSWMERLSQGLRKTGANISQVFTGAQIDDALYEELETALLLADTGVQATQALLDEVKRKVAATGATRPVQAKNILVDALSQLLAPLQKPLVIGEHVPTVIMVAGVNGAGKTTSIGKLTKHLADEGETVLLAAADTFRAAAREQLAIWADRNKVEIVSQEGGDPAAVSFDAVSAGKARRKDVVIVDTAGRLPTQLHLMEELKKIKRVIQKAGEPDGRAAAVPPRGGTAPSGGSAVREATSVGAHLPPHEVLLVIDGNTGQNALAQVKAFDDALKLTGLVVTKLDGTAKGGVLAAIAKERPVPVYFIGVGEKLEDLETFDAREFALALLQ
jgi:fused signal recognition particle receptor